MISKFEEIKNMAVFRNFNWNSSVLDSNGKPLTFKRVNIIFGRNYSGKTTLSRVVRSFETGKLSDKYRAPTFKLILDNSIALSEIDYAEKKLLTRVFNEDFIRDNLQFMINPDSSILPFAILGEDNARIEAEIASIKTILGTLNGDESTGLYKDYYLSKAAYSAAINDLSKAEEILERQNHAKATDKGTGIKYQVDRFGKQNYNIRDLYKDITTVQDNAYTIPSSEEISAFEVLLTEQKKDIAPEIRKPNLKLNELITSCKELCERRIGTSEKIQELLRDAALESWVKKGLEFNKDREYCAFCGQPLTQSRLDELYRHFDEEMGTLDSDIQSFLTSIEDERVIVTNAFAPDERKFYANNLESLKTLKDNFEKFKTDYCTELDKLKKLAVSRQKSIHKEITFEYKTTDLSCDGIFEQYSELREQSVKYGNNIALEKSRTQEALRLYEVKKHISAIDYSGQEKRINELRQVCENKRKTTDSIESKIKEKERLIEDKRRLLNDEEKGAVKINEYLSTYFGHRYLSLQAVKEDEYGSTKIHFEVIRNGEKAYHLSEGECSLIAFCYFVAKLDDIETAGKKPIIWIDDPASSLDSNHIYFLFSLIQSQILDKDSYEQLFVTTHNLVFLKYLHRMSINKHGNGTDRIHLLIERQGDESVIKLMPKYLKEHGTEFQHWFGLIYKCAHQTGCDDENIYLFESFGNTVRKFFEVYLYYRYPDEEKLHVHLQRFFGEDKIPAVIIGKIGDEQSHSQGDLENLTLPFEVPETVEAAKLVLKKLEERDKEQYDLLVASVKN